MDTTLRLSSALVVDDSPHMRILLLKFLQRIGVSDVRLASDGAEGLRLFQQSRPDVVFLDAVMPVMDGLTALREMKSRDPAIIVIMTTSISEKAKALQFKEAGADYYLLKPFDEQKFSETLQKASALLERQGKGK